MSYSSNHSEECHCKRRGPSSTSSDKTPSLSGSVPSRSSSSASLRPLRPFPASEPSDYCKPILSLNTRVPQHQRLAVLLPTDCWKSDADATECDTFHCETRFSLFERKHHCRRCGGVFCQSCSARTVPLLDTTGMPYMFPPAHIPIELLAASSPAGQLIPSRVCDDCHAQLTGQTPPSVILRRKSAASSEQTSSSSPSSSYSADHAGSSVHSASLYPPGTTFIAKPRHMRRPSTKRTKSSGSVHRSSSASSPRPSTASHFQPQPASQPATDYSGLGVLAEYPLKEPSKGCKSSGAAWWNPKPVPRRIDSPVRYDAQVPRCLREAEECEPEDDDEESPVVYIRRTVARCSETKIREAPFAYPEERRGKDCVSFF